MRFTDLLVSPEGFVPNESARTPDGVTPEMYFHLWDIAVKQGENFYSPKPGIQLRQNQIALEAYDFRGNGHGGSAGLSVFYYEEGRRFQSTSDGALWFHLQNSLSIMWDRRVTVVHVEDFIKVIDETLDEYGERDVNGVRIQTREDFQFWKDWKFSGTRCVSAPDISALPHAWLKVALPMIHQPMSDAGLL